MSNAAENGELGEQFPQYWDILSEEDKKGYHALKIELNPKRSKRYQDLHQESFQLALNKIKTYAERKDADDWKRFLVCGICWMDNSIAVNIRQLRLLFSKCKSSINGAFQKLGYLPAQSQVDLSVALYPFLPFLKMNYNDPRQWTLRYKGSLQKTQNVNSKVVNNDNALPQNPERTIHPVPLINHSNNISKTSGKQIISDSNIPKSNDNEHDKPIIPLKFRKACNRRLNQDF